MSKILTLELENEHDYQLIGIHTTLEDYRLVFQLNCMLNVSLKREKYDLDFEPNNATFALYMYHCNTTFSNWALIANKYISEVDSSKSEDVLFDKEFKTSFLIEEKKQLDYFLKIENDFHKRELNSIISSIKSINNVITSYQINPLTLKSKDFLIF